MAAFQGKDTCETKLCDTIKKEWLPDRHIHGQTDAGQKDHNVPLCFAGNTKMQQLWSDICTCKKSVTGQENRLWCYEKNSFKIKIACYCLSLNKNL